MKEFHSRRPAGWHLPTNAEWDVLITAAGGGRTAGKKLKAKEGWNDYEGKSGNGTDEFGFTALPGGSCQGGYFENAGNNGNWWSASEGNVDYRSMYPVEFAGRNNGNKSDMYSVRCLQD